MEFRGRWVLVTGASSGLGQKMVEQLARDHGANIIAVARRKDRLDELKQRLEAETKVEVVAIAADLSELSEVDRVLEIALKGRDLYGAILNAGVTHFGAHGKLEWLTFQKMLNTNVTSVVRMAAELIPHLEQHGLGGGLMLVSSMAGIMPIPYQSAYSGTKAFLVHFGCGLWHEMRGRNVSITTLAPGGIVTEMTAGESFGPLQRWLMPVDLAARVGLEAFRRRKYLYVPGYSNRLGNALYRLLPQRVFTGWLASSYRRALEQVGQI
jgi:short-subunit dehydrogenase